MRAHTARQRESEKLRAVEAFTLIEMLMVIAIIAAITVIGLPSLRGLGRSNVVTSATQQLVDDLMLARHKAIVNRTTVHVVFVPSSIKNSPAPAALSQRDRALWERLRGGAYTTYALYAERSLGDQPGQQSDRYLTEWRALPDGVFVGTNEYINPPSNYQCALSRLVARHWKSQSTARGSINPPCLPLRCESPPANMSPPG